MIYSYRKKDLLNGASCIKVVEWPSENSSVSPANTYTALQSTIATSAPLALIVQRKNPSRRFPKSWCARSFDAREVDRFFVLFFAAIWELNFYVLAGSTSGALAASVLCVTQIIITSRLSYWVSPDKNPAEVIVVVKKGRNGKWMISISGWLFWIKEERTLLK